MTATREGLPFLYDTPSRRWTSSTGGNEPVHGNQPVEWLRPYQIEPVTAPGQGAVVTEDPLPTLEEFMEDDRMRLAAQEVSEIATRTFGPAVSGIEQRVERDEVLGGTHLMLEVPVHGLERAQYKQLRDRFDEGVRNSLGPDQLSRIVWASRLDA